MTAQLAKVGLLLPSLARCWAHIEPKTAKTVQQWLYLACYEGSNLGSLHIATWASCITEELHMNKSDLAWVAHQEVSCDSYIVI